MPGLTFPVVSTYAEICFVSLSPGPARRSNTPQGCLPYSNSKGEKPVDDCGRGYANQWDRHHWGLMSELEGNPLVLWAGCTIIFDFLVYTRPKEPHQHSILGLFHPKIAPPKSYNICQFQNLDSVLFQDQQLGPLGSSDLVCGHTYQVVPPYNSKWGSWIANFVSTMIPLACPNCPYRRAYTGSSR